MKERIDCNLVQDLLPNYIEKLTNEETNKFIEDHLKNCKECKEIYENMKKEIEIKESKRDKREVEYAKKFNIRFKLIRNILLIIIAIFVLVVGRRYFILSSLTNKAKASLQNNNNYYTKTENYSEGKMIILETYNKDGYTKGKYNAYREDKITKMILYKSPTEKFLLIDNGENKSMVTSSFIEINPVYFTGEGFIENLYQAIVSDIQKINLHGKECYLIKEGENEKFIDIETGLAIKMIDNRNNMTIDYTYKFNNVNDEDIKRPDTEGYTLSEE